MRRSPMPSPTPEGETAAKALTDLGLDLAKAKLVEVDGTRQEMIKVLGKPATMIEVLTYMQSGEGVEGTGNGGEPVTVLKKGPHEFEIGARLESPDSL